MRRSLYSNMHMYMFDQKNELFTEATRSKRRRAIYYPMGVIEALELEICHEGQSSYHSSYLASIHHAISREWGQHDDHEQWAACW